MLGLLVALVVGVLAVPGVIVGLARPGRLAKIEAAGAACMALAIIFVALDGGDLHWEDGTHYSFSFLYWLWALVAILFLASAAVARSRRSTSV